MGLAAVLVLAACGSSGSSSGGLYGGGGSSSSATSAPTAPSAPATVKTATVTLDGKSQTILTSAQGRTLYYFTPDSATSSACTGNCAQTWPPLLQSGGSSSVTSSGSLPGSLTVLNDANGAQVAYNGHPLYTYSGDKASGDTKGQDLFDKWYAATPALAVNTPPTATPGY